jgi:hypothetical protein
MLFAIYPRNSLMDVDGHAIAFGSPGEVPDLI